VFWQIGTKVSKQTVASIFREIMNMEAAGFSKICTFTASSILHAVKFTRNTALSLFYVQEIG
jgi:hypothetical protein